MVRSGARPKPAKQGGRLPFDLRSLEIFLAVCETGGMAAAARRLAMTQPAVSLAIAEIETRGRVILFDRKVRPLGLTPAGVMLRQKASYPLVRIGLVDALSRSLAGDLAAFLSARADEVSVQTGLTALHASAFFTRRLDILIGVDELIEVDGLERRPILEEPYVMLWPKRLGKLADPFDLEQLVERAPLVRFSARSKTGAEIDQHLRRLRLEVPRRLEFDTPFAVAAAVAAGLGWAITTPLCLMEADLAVDDMQIGPLPAPGLRRRLTLVARHGELGPLPGQVAELAHDRLRSLCRAFIKRHCPALKDEVVIGTKAH